MPTPAERRALLFVATVAALGIGVRGCRTLGAPPVPVNDREALARQIAAVDSAVASGGRRRAAPTKAGSAPSGARSTSTPVGSSQAQPPGAGVALAPPRALVDVDRAGVAELVQLPGIGPALAARILADRESNGGFGSLTELQRVKGIGPALAAKLGPFVTFSAPPRPSRAVESGRQGAHP